MNQCLTSSLEASKTSDEEKEKGVQLRKSILMVENNEQRLNRISAVTT